MKHIDLFSGIGGFAIAAEMVWENVEHVFCDNDAFAQKILQKHWPQASIVSDIRQFTLNAGSDQHRPVTKKIHAASKIPCVDGETLDARRFSGADLLTGGFPCQPFSQAGQRKGTADDRYLWPEMLRVIREFHPRWIIGENVGGLVTWSNGLVLEQVQSDLEGEGYTVQAFVIPAAGVNAPHRRDRVWIVANSNGAGLRQQSESEQGRGGETINQFDNETATDATSNGVNGWCGPSRSHSPGMAASRKKRSDASSENQRRDWNRNWIKVAAWYGRMDDGLSSWLDDALRRINGTSYKTNNNKDLYTLQTAFSSQEVREAFGRLYAIPDTAILLSALRGIPRRGYEKWAHDSCSEMAKEFLRGMWEQREIGRAPQRWQHNEQLEKEHKDLLPHLPYEASLALAEAWHCVRFALENREDQDGYKLKGMRNKRLKALGNAIVPQVAAEIMHAMI